MAESKGAIVTAMGANLAIAAAKFVGVALTGSSSMLAEGAHSIVDTTNQALLLVGMKRAERPANARHPFGYGREIYFYSFVVALLIFTAGGIFSIFEGIEKTLYPEPETSAHLFGLELPGVVVNVAILGFAILAEGYSFLVAYRALPKAGGSPLSTVRRSKDPSLFVVVLEDAAALVGLLVALAGVGLANLLEMPALDGVASIGIGVVLIGTAALLMVETHGLLIGEAADPDVVAKINDAVRGEPDVHHVNEVLTQHLGPRDILVNVSLDIRNDMTGGQIEILVSRLEAKLREDNQSALRVFIEIQAKGTRPSHFYA